MPTIPETQEGQRLALNSKSVGHWNRWGPYLSERAWGTVREDYSADGDAWSFFPHDHARSKSYRWNEDGLGGICDRHQCMCFALALWNGRDSILKERMFGLANREGNHGEDVKEYFFHLDSTPTHSYMKFLYKYPQTAYPYRKLVEVNASRTRLEMEYELIDTGVFDGGRYFDVEIEYAKSAADAFSKSPFEMALVLAERDPAHRRNALWDETDGFFYDALRRPDGRWEPVRARTIVGFVPLFESVLLENDAFDKFPAFERRRRWFIEHRPNLVDSVGPMIQPGQGGRTLMRLVRSDQLRRLLAYMLDENEFFSPCGVRSVSRYHRDHPYVVALEGREYRLDYEPGESTTGLFWRQLELARSGLDSAKLSDPRSARSRLRILRRSLSRGMSHRLGPHDDLARSGRRARATRTDDDR